MSGDRGAAALPVLGIVGLLIILGFVVSDVGRYLAARSQVVAAADAAALAAAPVTFHAFGARTGPRGEAARFATANGARLLRCICALDPSFAPRRVEVVVAASVDLSLFGRREVRARSRAEFRPVAVVLPG